MRSFQNCLVSFKSDVECFILNNFHKKSSQNTFMKQCHFFNQFDKTFCIHQSPELKFSYCNNFNKLLIGISAKKED